MSTSPSGQNTSTEASGDPTAVASSIDARGWKVLLEKTLSTLGPILALLLIIAAFSIAADVKNRRAAAQNIRRTNIEFATLDNFRTLASRAAFTTIAALGMTAIIISGGIDLSAGTCLALTATVMATCLAKGYSAPVATLAAVGCGALCGFFNGLLVSSLRIVPFIVTLGTMTIFRGASKLVAGKSTVEMPPDVVLPIWLTSLMDPNSGGTWLIKDLFPGFAPSVYLTVILSIVMAAILHRTIFGRYLFAVGSNESTARLCGVNVPLVKIAVYTLGGIFVGIAGVCFFSRLQIGDPDAGLGRELKIIAAVVIGGASLNGGRGTIIGTLAGAAIMEVIDNGCVMLDIRDEITNVLIGAIIIAAATVDQWRQRRMQT